MGHKILNVTDCIAHVHIKKQKRIIQRRFCFVTQTYENCVLKPYQSNGPDDGFPTRLIAMCSSLSAQNQTDLTFTLKLELIRKYKTLGQCCLWDPTTF